MNAFSMILTGWILFDINKNNCSKFNPNIVRFFYLLQYTVSGRFLVLL